MKKTDAEIAMDISTLDANLALMNKDDISAQKELVERMGYIPILRDEVLVAAKIPDKDEYIWGLDTLNDWTENAD